MESTGHIWRIVQKMQDPLMLAILSLVFLAILLTGYLIIYNIFYISVVQDIRFYGLLKTVGTTKKNKLESHNPPSGAGLIDCRDSHWSGSRI